jgi:hypothetical protein
MAMNLRKTFLILGILIENKYNESTKSLKIPKE